MKKLQILLYAIILLAGGSVLYSKMRNPCSEPIRYSLGNFDARFGLTQKEFLKGVSEAESVWETPAGKELFIYDPTASFKINLVYDERQKRTDEYATIKNDLESSETKFKSIEEEYNALIPEYDAKRATYDEASAQFDADLSNYESDVRYWNEKGGAPEATYNELKKTKEELNSRADRLESDRQELNAISRRINILAEQGNDLAEDYHSVVSTYNQKFGTTTEFDQGDYRGREINIYQFKELSDLKMAIAHELGHSLGLSHVSDPKAVMYYFMGEQNLSNLAATDADVAALAKHCKLQ